MNKSRQIAVVGSGVAGTVAAWLLRGHTDVHLYEADSRFGGHTHTVTVDEGDNKLAVDTGFMVYNRPNYPLLTALFEHLGIASYPTDMSFSASFDNGRLEYAGSSLDTLFAQRRNLARPGYWAMLLDIVRFNRAARRALVGELPSDLALGEFLDRCRLGSRFRRHYLYPMAAAIWSCPSDRIAQFPAVSFLRFFANHGLIDLVGRPQWQTVEGGSRTYLERLIADLGERAVCNRPVTRVARAADGVLLGFADGASMRFDDVVLACHSDQSLRILADPMPSERWLLEAVPYQANRVVLHTDRALMPRSRRAWASWNYLGGADPGQPVGVTYWMNSLQRLDSQTDYFVSLNPAVEPDAQCVIREFCYEHPLFDARALDAQQQLQRVQGRAHLWFAGAWTGYGFHEDGIRSGMEVAMALGAPVPWQQQAQASRDLAAPLHPPRRAA